MKIIKKNNKKRTMQQTALGNAANMKTRMEEKPKQARNSKKSVTNVSRPKQQAEATISTSSRLEAPSKDAEELNENKMEVDEEINKTKPYNPPPILIHTNTMKQPEIIRIMNDLFVIAKDTEIRYLYKNLIAYTKNQITDDATRDYLQTHDINHRTLPQKGKRNKEFVIKGLPRFRWKDVLHSLENQGLQIKELKRMKTAQKDHPYFYISLDPELDTSAIFKIKTIRNIRIRWEKYKNPKRGTHCCNYQFLGHSTSNCSTKSISIKCARKHESRKRISNKSKLKCVNCGEKHPANCSQCQPYLPYLQNIDQRQQMTASKQKPQGSPPTVLLNDEQNFPKLSATNQLQSSRTNAVITFSPTNSPPIMERHIAPEEENSKLRADDISVSDFTSRYLVDFDPINCLGKGGYGIVFKARNKIDKCEYAIKRITLPNGHNSQERVLREVRCLARLRHPNIVGYYNAWLEQPPSGWQGDHDRRLIDKRTFSASEFSTEVSSPTSKCSDSMCIDGSHSDPSCINRAVEALKVESSDENENRSIVFEKPNAKRQKFTKTYLYIQMQLCRETSLKDWLKHERTPRDMRRAVHIFDEIVDAVEYVHLQRLIHRDLTPSNIFFSFDDKIKIGDFGLVTAMTAGYDEERTSDETTETNNLGNNLHTARVGTHLYMSPEQMAGQSYDYKVDIYSLGIIFYELLVPFSTQMERFNVLNNLRKSVFTKDFSDKYSAEYDLLKRMLDENPKERPTTSEIRFRLPLVKLESESDVNRHQDFDLSPSSKHSSAPCSYRYLCTTEET